MTSTLPERRPDAELTAEELPLAVLSVPVVFDDSTGADVLNHLAPWLASRGSAVRSALFHELLVAGAVEHWAGVLSIREPLRGNLRRRLAEQQPESFRQVASRFAHHAGNGFGPTMTRALGPQPAAISKAVLEVLADDDDAGIDELVGLLASPEARGRRVDNRIAVTQLSQVPPLSGRVERGLAFLTGLELWRAHRREEAVEYFNRVVSQPAADKAEAIALHLLGVALTARGEFEEANGNFNRALGLLMKQRDDRGLAQTLISQGRNQRMVGELQEASGDPVAAALSYEHARACLDEAIERLDSDERHIEGAVRLELARVDAAEGLLEFAIEEAETACGMLASGDDLLNGLTVLAGLYRDTGRHDEALRTLQRAMSAAASSPSESRSLARLLNVQASTERQRGNVEVAVQLATQSVEMGRRLDDKRHTAHALHTLGVSLANQAKDAESIAQALETLLESRQLLKGLPDPRGVKLVDRSIRAARDRSRKLHGQSQR